jgi:VacB/RNase II family 3'-5' exoribonuclease
VSIDNDDSRDLDQISAAQALAAGAVRLWVAIADVDALVPRGSPVDDHARINTTSVYTEPQVFPMLPERLSTDLTSLGAGQERLAMVVELTLDVAGTLEASSVYRARVVNQAKLAYPSVARWLEGSGPAPPALAAAPALQAPLRLQDAAAQALRRLRQAHGALELETIETQATIEDGVLTDLLPRRNNRAQQLIEDLMVAANGVVARFLEAQGSPALRRIVRTPKRWERIVALAAAAGEKLPSEPDALALDGFLRRRRAADPEHFPDLSLAVVKLLGSGEYVAQLPGTSAQGHFALAVSAYTHSTAPNRRFPDVISQRLLKAALARQPPPYGPEELEQLAAHCTLQEDNAEKVERQVHKSAAALLLSSRIGQQFSGIVTGASDKGTWVRIDAPPVEGRIVRGYRGLDVGARIQVQLLHTDVDRGYIDFASTGTPP